MSSSLSLTISEDSLAKINILRESIRDIWRPEFDDDYYLQRWLRAREFDLKKSEQMLRDHIAWRAREKIDTILETFKMPEVLQKYYPGGFCGYDKDGSPIWIDPTGTSDPKGLSRSCCKSLTLRSRIYLMEKTSKQILPQSSARIGHPVHGITIIYDLDHFGMRHLWKPAMQFFIDFTRTCEANYPETMKLCFIVNAPAIFPIAYRLIAPFLHERTKEKIKVLGSDWKRELLNYIDEDNLPVYFGGTMVDENGDAKCSANVCWGGEVPESYYDLGNIELMKEAIIGRGSTLQLDFEVKHPNSLLQWEFILKDYDIKFAIFYKESTSRQKAKEMTEIFPSSKIMAHHALERGELECVNVGHYVIRFDNTYSWTRSKQLWYRIEIENPEANAGSDDDEESFFDTYTDEVPPPPPPSHTNDEDNWKNQEEGGENNANEEEPV